MQMQTVANEHRPQNVVDSANDNPAPACKNERSDPTSIQNEQQCRRYPDDKGPKDRHDRQEAHHQPPQQRRGKTEHPEHEAPQGALNRGNRKRSIDCRVDRFRHPPQHLFRLKFRQREPRNDHGLGSQPVAQEIKQQVEGYKHLDRLKQ